MSGQLICAICPTFNRPELLGRAIQCFERQTYENRYLVIVDDLGQYPRTLKGDRWELVSINRRCLTLGEKNNICISLAPRDTYGYAKWDDDDFYSPWHLEAIADALDNAHFVQPHVAIDYWHGGWKQVETFGQGGLTRHFCYHGQWGYTRHLIGITGGYRPTYAGDDQEFQRRVSTLYSIDSVDINRRKYQPSYWYNRPLEGRISMAEGTEEEAYWRAGTAVCHSFIPKWTDESDWERPIPEVLIRRPW